MVKADISSPAQTRLDPVLVFHFLRSVLLVGMRPERNSHTLTPQRDSTLFIDVYMQYIMYVFFQTFRIGLLETRTITYMRSNNRKVMAVMHLFILRVNLLTCFFVFMSVLSAPHETDGGIYIFHVFLYLVL